jgi:DNA-binding transcriptional MerR regulator
MPGMEEYISLPAAAKDAGVPVRTLRYWVTTGKVPKKAGKRGYLVRLSDVKSAAALARREETTNTAPSVTDEETTASAAEPAQSVVPLAARAQLAAVMDEWVLPLMERIAALEHKNGQLEERLETVTRERDAARANTQQAATPKPVNATAPNAPPSFWRRLFRIE